MRQVYNGVYLFSAEEKKMNMCASFYWEYVIMDLKFMFKRTQ
jgi:Iap family predicted aminopeptidase